MMYTVTRVGIASDTLNPIRIDHDRFFDLAPRHHQAVVSEKQQKGLKV